MITMKSPRTSSFSRESSRKTTSRSAGDLISLFLDASSSFCFGSDDDDDVCAAGVGGVGGAVATCCCCCCRSAMHSTGLP